MTGTPRSGKKKNPQEKDGSGNGGWERRIQPELGFVLGFGAKNPRAKSLEAENRDPLSWMGLGELGMLSLIPKPTGSSVFIPCGIPSCFQIPFSR